MSLKDIAFLCRSYLSPSDIMRNQPHLLIIGTGFAFGFLVVRPIVVTGYVFAFVQSMPCVAVPFSLLLCVYDCLCVYDRL